MPLVVPRGGRRRRRLLERLPGRLRRADGAHGAAAAAGARTASRPSTRRSPSRWRSASTRWRWASPTKVDAALVVGCGPVGLAVIAALAPPGHRPDRGLRLLAEAARASPSSSAPTWSSTPRSEKPVDAWQKAAGAAGRPLIFECVGRAGRDRRADARRAARRAHRGGRRLHGGRPHPADATASTRSSRSSSCSATRPTSSPARCARSPTARSRREPLVTGRVGIDGVARGLPHAARSGGPRQDPGRAREGLSAWRPRRARAPLLRRRLRALPPLGALRRRRGPRRARSASRRSAARRSARRCRRSARGRSPTASSCGAPTARCWCAPTRAPHPRAAGRRLAPARAPLLAVVPRRLRDAGYDFVARRRAALVRPRPSDACPLVPPHLRGALRALAAPRMPELPEVEVTRRRIEPCLVGRRMARVRDDGAQLLLPDAAGAAAARAAGPQRRARSSAAAST